MEAHLLAIDRDETVGCVVLRGAGKGFCAGADLKAIGDAAGRPPSFKSGVVERLGRLRQPVIAAVHGVCFTGGMELALACDFILADATARFADTHGKWGLVGQWGMMQRLPRRVGMSAAKRMMMTARIVEAEEGKTIGLVHMLAPEGGLDAMVRSLAGRILANSWFTNFAVKRLTLETDGMSLAAGLAHERRHHPGFAPDHRQRIERFARKG